MSGSLPLLRELIDLEELQSIQDSFARAAGISSVILSPEGEPLTKFTNPTGFCSLIQSTEKGKVRCAQSFMEMGKNALLSKEPEIYYCFAHGGHFVAPIMIDGEHKGTMFAGQFIPEKFSSEQLHDLEEIAHEIDLDPGLLVKEAEKMRVVGEDVIRNYSTLLFNIVETITRRGAQAAELGRVNDALEKAHEALELRFRDIAGAMSDWVWEVDAGARYTYCSEKVKDVLGYSAEEMIGKTPFDFMLPDEAESVGAAFAELVRERRPFRNMESWLRTRDGRSVCMLISGVPILDDAGELLGYRGVDSDITERKNAEEALQKEKDRAQHYLDIAGVMFLVIGADRKVSLINKKGYEILGYEEEEEITGKDWFDNFIPERLRDEVARVFNSLIAGEIEQVECHENPVLTKHGEERIVAWHNTILRDEQGRIYATMASGEDITERKKMEETLRIAHENTKTILEKASFGVVVIGRDRKIKWVNDTALKMAGVENTDILLGENCGKYLCPAQQKECPILDKGQQVDNSERIFRRKDGKEIPIIKTVIEINMDGEAVLLETFIDITERKAAEEELKKRAGELEKFNKLAVSRELKMIELKKEINALLGELGKEPGYKIVGES